jgi:hypothetical protein
VQFLHTSMRSVIDFTHLDFALVLTCPSAVTNLASGKGALTNPASGETALTNALWRGLDGQLPVGAGKGARTAATNCSHELMPRAGGRVAGTGMGDKVSEGSQDRREWHRGSDAVRESRVEGVVREHRYTCARVCFANGAGISVSYDARCMHYFESLLHCIHCVILDAC